MAGNLTHIWWTASVNFKPWLLCDFAVVKMMLWVWCVIVSVQAIDVQAIDEDSFLL